MKRINIVLIFVSLLTWSFASASDPNPAPKQKKPIALLGATVHTVSGSVIENGTVVFDKGKIIAVGTNVSIPADAEQINLRGKHVYPGLIDAYNSLGLIEVSLGAPGTVDNAEAGQINPNVRAEVAINPETKHIPVARSGGITVVGVSPGGGLISGLSAAVMMDGWTWEDLTLKSGIGLVVNWPVMVYTPSPFSQQSKEDWQKQRDTQLKALQDAFVRARAYMVAKQAKGQKGIPSHDTDPRWEAMIPVLQGKTPVVVNANELSQIQAAITWAEQEGVKLIIAGGVESIKIADHLKEKNIPVIVADVQSAGRRWEDYDVVLSLPKKLFDAGVRFCITGDRGGSNARSVPYHAANAAAYGLPKDEALKSVTLYAAQILGIADKVGSLEVGKDATMIVTNGDPLEMETNVEQEFIQGKKIDLRDKQKQLYEKYKEKYRQISGQ